MSLPSDNEIAGAVAVSRFGLGPRPGELADAVADPKGWLKAQIDRRGADQPPGPLPNSRDRFLAYLAARLDRQSLKREAAAVAEQAPASSGAMSQMAPTAISGQDMAAAVQVGQSPLERLKAERRAAQKPLRDGVAAEILARAQLAATTPAPFRERWALFWFNHFTVSTAKPAVSVLVGPFEREAIRPHVFGRFEDLLYASSTHPAMLMYLDQERSTGPDSPGGLRRSAGLNENLAREILELHTVGADSGYTQADVTEFARALTGYSIGIQRDGDARDGLALTGRPLYRPQLHEPGARMVMGRRYPDAGQGQARAILTDLASSPHTADHIARKLAAHFVADDPPPSLVARLRSAYLESRGDLAMVAVALIDAPEAWSPAPMKFKRPYEFVMSGYRIAGAAPIDPERELIQPLTLMGERPMAAPQPNGWSEQAGDWTAPDAIVKRLNWSAAFAAAHAPSEAPLQVADGALGARLTAPTRLAVMRAESRPEALTLVLMSPEFQRR